MSCQRPFLFCVPLTKLLKRDNAGHGDSKQCGHWKSIDLTHFFTYLKKWADIFLFRKRADFCYQMRLSGFSGTIFLSFFHLKSTMAQW